MNTNRNMNINRRGHAHESASDISARVSHRAPLQQGAACEHGSGRPATPVPFWIQLAAADDVLARPERFEHDLEIPNGGR